MTEQQETPPAGEGLDARVGALETGQETMSGKIDRILNLISGGDKTEAHAEETTGAPENVAEEIRAQLTARDAKAKADADEQARTDRLAAAEAKIAELAEKPPEPLLRRSTVFMWGKP
jgi:hypothetical protein